MHKNVSNDERLAPAFNFIFHEGRFVISGTLGLEIKFRLSTFCDFYVAWNFHLSSLSAFLGRGAERFS